LQGYENFGAVELILMEKPVKAELLRLAKKLRKKAEKFEKNKDFTRAENARVYATYLEETAKNLA
jgi:hypothetical protein